MIINANAYHIPLANDSVQCCVTSPPYWNQRDYGHPDQIGQEPTPQEFIANLVKVFREVRRVLKPNGTCFVNLGDGYVDDALDGFKVKDLIGAPWMLAFALRDDGWYLRSDIIWAKSCSGQREYLQDVADAAANVGIESEKIQALLAALDLPVGTTMPESVKDRPTKAHEYIFMLSKSPRYLFNSDDVKEDGVFPAGTRAAKGSKKRSSTALVNSRPAEYAIYSGKRNLRSVFAVSAKAFKGAHFATFPLDLAGLCVRAGSNPGDIVLDPFGGSGTTAEAALMLKRKFISLELNADYLPLQTDRLDPYALPTLDM